MSDPDTITVTILSSDSEDVQEVQSGNNECNTPQDNVATNARRAPLQRIATGKEVFSDFLQKCKSNDKSSEMEKIVQKLWKRFNEAEERYTKSRAFKELVLQAQGKIDKGLYSTMKTVADELSNNKKSQTKPVPKSSLPSTSASSTTCVDNGNEELDPKTLSHINKLENVLDMLHRRIQKLENLEVDLNSSDEENSVYIQVTRYKTRFCQVFKKLCELKKKDPHAERVLKKVIKFSATQIPEVDKAIEKFYNAQREFPDYRDILTVVKKANEVKKLNLSSGEITNLALKAFQDLGKMLKTYRQLDDAEIIGSYLPNDEDPASEDTNLREALEDNKKKYGNRIDEIIDKYAVMQDEEPQEDTEINSDAEVEESEDEDSETDMESRSSILGSRSDLEESADEADQNHYPTCRVVLSDVRNSSAWEQYVLRKQETEKQSPDKYPVVVIEKTFPLYPSRKRSSGSDLDDDSLDERVENWNEPGPSTSQQVPITLSNFRHIKRAKIEKHVESTRDESDKAISMKNVKASTQNDNDVIEVISSPCEKNGKTVEFPEIENIPNASASVMDLDVLNDEEISFSNSNFASSTQNFSEENVETSSDKVETPRTVENDVPTLESNKIVDASIENSKSSSASSSKSVSEVNDEQKDESQKTTAVSKSPKENIVDIEMEDPTSNPEQKELLNNIDQISNHFMCNGDVSLEVVSEENSSAKNNSSAENQSKTAQNTDGVDIVILDEIIKSKTPTKINSDVIDVEELSDSPKKPEMVNIGTCQPINLTQMIRNMDFKKEMIPKSNFGTGAVPTNRLMRGSLKQLPIVSRNQFNQNKPANVRSMALSGHRQTAPNNVGCIIRPTNKYPSAANRINPFINMRSMSNGRQFDSMQSRNVQNAQYFSNNANVTMKTGQAAMQRRHVTQRMIQTYDSKTNKIITRKETTTVVQQSIMQVGVSSGNPRTINHQMRHHVSKQRISSNRNISSDDVITLD